MTGSDTLQPTPLSEKLYLVTHHHLLTRVPYLRSDTTDTSSSSLAPLTPEELKVDKIVLSWILFTLSDSLRARLVVMRPKSAREAWGLISEIVKDNKRSRANALKAELRSIKLGDQSMESYFQKIDSLVTILTSLEDPDTFLDLKMVRSLLISEEIPLKSKALTLPVDSSSSNVSCGRIRGTCHLDDFLVVVLHDANARVGTSNSTITRCGTNTNNTNELLNKLLNQLGNLGLHHTVAKTTTHTPPPVAFVASPLSDVFNSCMYSSVLVGDGHSIPVTNTDHSILQTPSKTLRLNNVLITPHIVKNLIFVRQFVCDNDCTIEFDSFGFSVKDFMTRQVLLRCDSTGDLYPVTAPSPITHAFLVSQHTWLQRLGHPGSEVLRRLLSNNIISCNKENPPGLCHACQLGKHVRLPLSVLCDHGGEFDNRKLHDLFSTNGIQFRFSCPKTSQQNGKSERMVRTLNNIIRTLLFQANLPPTFWVEALNMATRLLNILPSTAIANDVPFTRLLGTSPDYSLLRTFGCLCYPHLYHTTKFEPRATPSIFLGHASNHRGYRCLDLNTNKILISRHVTFDETVFPYGSAKPVSVPSYDFLDDPEIPLHHVSVFSPSTTTPPASPGPNSPSPTAQPNITLHGPNTTPPTVHSPQYKQYISQLIKSEERLIKQYIDISKD
ncbi:ribonuclease H-like domain-containing protein [Tanacetum coccineum]